MSSLQYFSGAAHNLAHLEVYVRYSRVQMKSKLCVLLLKSRSTGVSRSTLGPAAARMGHVVDVCAAFPVEVVLFLVFALSSSAKHSGKRMAAWTARGWRAAAAQRTYSVR